MNNVWKLTKLFLKSSIFRNRFGSEEKTKKKIIQSGFLLLAFLYVVGIFGYISYQMIQMLQMVNQASLFLGIWLMGTTVLLLIQSFISSLNLFYFSKDVEYILPLPIKPHQILMAKLNVLLVTEYFTVMLLALIPFTLYGILTGACLLYYVNSILVLLFFPIVPVLISCMLVVIIMSFSRMTKNKEIFQVIATLLVVGIVIGFQMIFPQDTEQSNEQILANVQRANGLVEQIEPYFITLKPAVNALIYPDKIAGGVELIKLLVITAFSYVAFVILAQKLYLKGAVGALNSGRKKRKRRAEKNTYQVKSVGYRYVKKEFTMLIKNPIYLMQCVLPCLFIPIVFAFVFLTGANEKLAIFDTVQLDSSLVLCVMVGINVFFLSMNLIPTSAISRDGQNATFMKYIPVPLYHQIWYKMVPAIFLFFIPTFLTIGIGKAVMHADEITCVYVFFLTTCISILYAYCMILVDLKRPKLNWDTEYAVVKQNMNFIWEFVYVIVVMIVLGGACVLLSSYNIHVLAMTLGVIFLLAIVGVDYYLRHHVSKLFKKIGSV